METPPADGMPAFFSSTAFAGLIIGLICGFFVRRARLCSFGAIETALTAHDWRRMKVFGLALGIAMAGTQLLVFAGILDPARTSYVPNALPWLGALAGSLAFGLGMALIGTCAFGSLVRLGGGDLRSLIALIVFGLVAYAVLRGTLSSLRILGVEAFAIRVPGGGPASAQAALRSHVGGGAALVASLLLAAVLITIAAADRRLWRAPRLVTAGVVLGLGVVAGWLATTLLIDEFSSLQRVQSLTFVAPVARALASLAIGGPELGDFGVGSVFGVIAGSFLAARLARDFHWEAYDDPREMRRHLIGATLMGGGGILAGGCTIGQGLTAGSLLAASWVIVVPGIILGARIGIAMLVEDSLTDAVTARLRNWMAR